MKSYPQALSGFFFIQDSKIQDSGPDRDVKSMGCPFYYEVLGDSCEVLGGKGPLTMRNRGNIMRFWGHYCEVLGAVIANKPPSIASYEVLGEAAPDG
jgi:hypothetical protein